MVNLFPHAADHGIHGCPGNGSGSRFPCHRFHPCQRASWSQAADNSESHAVRVGHNPVGSTRDRFSIHYYLVAMVYIIFDVETIFLYPWAGILRSELGVFGWVEMMVFMLILLVGYVYVIGKGALEWD